MGNCQDEFNNVPDIDSEWVSKQRVDINTIDPTHLSLRPKDQDIVLGQHDQKYCSQHIDVQKLHDTKVLFNASRLKFSKKSVLSTKKNSIDSRRQLEPLNYQFYYQLALPQYKYQEIPSNQKHNFNNLQLCENIDKHGVKYVGQIQNGQLHGNGVLTSNTRKYIGQFRNGLKHFHGREIQKNQVYQGKFENGRRKGYGKRYTRQSIEEGQFDDELIYGTIQYSNGTKYKGRLKNKKYDGDDCYYQDDKVKYLGKYTEGIMSGYGNITYKQNNYHYQGDFENGQKHGYGVFTWDEHTQYKGYYKHDRKHGEGILTVQGKIYKGIFDDNLTDGMIEYTNGSTYYKGTIKDGKFHGEDCHYEDNTISYDGRFHEGKMKQGKILYKKTNYEYIGQLQNQKKHGKGTFIWNQNIKYEGDYALDYKHGQGKLTYYNKIYNGDFSKDLFNGSLKIFEQQQQDSNNFRIMQLDQNQSSIFEGDLPQAWK